MSIGVTDIIAPLGSFPVVEDANLKGGYQTSPSTVDRDAIPAANRKVGMLVYTVATDETWILGPGITNGDWSAYNSASALSVKNETVELSPAVVSIDFQGAGVDATGTTNVVVTIPGSTPLGGTTAARPVAPAQYTTYWDTTLGISITYVGAAWYNAAGVAV